MNTRIYKAHAFFQYGSDANTYAGQLVSFAAPAAEIIEWAGVPRKSWTLRALYQRILDDRRLDRVGEFFTPSAASGVGNLSPTAVTIALTDAAIQTPSAPGAFDLSIPIPPLPIIDERDSELSRLAKKIVAAHLTRFDSATKAALEGYANAKITRAQLEAELSTDDYVALFVADLLELAADPSDFLAQRNVESPLQLLDALYELSKPALIVDGQHRVFGARNAKGPPVSFLICAIPHCSWREQAFQFVVINEEARPVDATILYDIFGSSLTRNEAEEVRKRLGHSGRDIEKRIAAVVAYRDEESPFANMVQLRVEDLPAGIKPYLSPRLIVDLIDGSRGTRGFRSDPDFLQWVVTPTLDDNEDESSWTAWYNGRWRPYWYALWRAVRDYFNARPPNLWLVNQQSNLTKGVSLKALQDLLLEEMIIRARGAHEQADELRQLAVEEDKIATFLERHRLPSTPETFYERVKSELLEGFPQKFYDRPWVKSLDTAAGMQALRTVLQETWSSYVAKGGNRKYPYWKNALIFEVKDSSADGA